MEDRGSHIRSLIRGRFANPRTASLLCLIRLTLTMHVQLLVCDKVIVSSKEDCSPLLKPQTCRQVEAAFWLRIIQYDLQHPMVK